MNGPKNKQPKGFFVTQPIDNLLWYDRPYYTSCFVFSYWNKHFTGTYLLTYIVCSTLNKFNCCLKYSLFNQTTKTFRHLTLIQYHYTIFKIVFYSGMDASFSEILYISHSHGSCRPSGDCGGSRDRTRDCCVTAWFQPLYYNTVLFVLPCFIT
jgi:hypothetical protein